MTLVEIEVAVGGAYEMPDGRQFWIDGTVAREIARRVDAAMQKEAERGDASPPQEGAAATEPEGKG